MYTRITEYSEFDILRQKFGRSIYESTEPFRITGWNDFSRRYFIGERLGDVA